MAPLASAERMIEPGRMEVHRHSERWHAVSHHDVVAQRYGPARWGSLMTISVLPEGAERAIR